VILSISFLKIWKLNDKNAKDVIIVYPDFPRDLLLYFYSDAFINDVAIVNSFVKQNIKFNLVIRQHKVLKMKGKNIFYNLGNRYRKNNLDNYFDALIKFVERVSIHNECYPSLEEVKWWENKAYMHIKFKELGIKEPKSNVVETNKFSAADYDEFNFPFLIKEVHSAGSLGVHKVENIDVLNEIIAKIKKENLNEHVIIQELLSMDRDLRVIIVGSEIVLYYWRINRSSEWKPTSTRHGSDVDFDFFPEEWRTHIIEVLGKIGLRTGAFDLVWENNDYSKSPYILEVSSSFQPNPVPPKIIKGSYGEWKAGFNFINGYPARFIDIVNEIKAKLLLVYKQIEK